MTPPSTSYTLKTVFDENPVIRNNKLTTAFKAQSPRRAFGLAFAPGYHNDRMHETMPSSAEYIYENKSVGTDSLFTKFKERGSKPVLVYIWQSHTLKRQRRKAPDQEPISTWKWTKLASIHCRVSEGPKRVVGPQLRANDFCSSIT